MRYSRRRASKIKAADEVMIPKRSIFNLTYGASARKWGKDRTLMEFILWCMVLLEWRDVFILFLQTPFPEAMSDSR